MTTLESLSERDLRGLLSPQNLKRAWGCVSLIHNPVRSGQTLTAQVGDTWVYDVEIDLGPKGITTSCNCPRIWEGNCEHIGAVLLKWIRSPVSFVQDAPLAGKVQPMKTITVAPPPTHRPQELPYWMIASLTDRQQADDQQLAKQLDGTVLRDLRQMAKRRGWKIKGARKADVIRQIVARMADPDEVSEAYESLDKEQQHVLRALLLMGDAPRLQTKDVLQVAGAWGKLEQPNQVTTGLAHLCEIGLATRGNTGARTFRDDFVPPSVARHLPPALQGLIPASQPSGEIVLADPYALVRAASQVVLLLEQSPSPLRPPMPRFHQERFYPSLAEWDYDPAELEQAEKDKKLQPYSDLILTVPPPRRSLPQATIQRLAPVVGDEARLEFIFSLLAAAGVFQPGSPVTTWPKVKMQFLKQDELAQRAILARVYATMPNWSALWEMLRRASPLGLKRDWKYQHFKPGHLRADLVHFRLLVLRVLASLPDGQWMALQDLFRLMRTLWPRFDQTAWQTYWQPSSNGGWYLSKAGSTTPLRPQNRQHWRLAQGDFIHTLIAGPLHWLGLADLGLDDDGALTSARFHGLADLYWDRVETLPASPYAPVQAAAPQEVNIQHHTINVHPSAISSQAHALLDQISRLDTASADRFVYRLNPQATYEAFEAGVTLAEILGDWEKLMPIPMPDGIRAQLTDWWDAFGRVRLYEDLTMIEFGDDYALAEMMAVTSLDKRLIAQLSPRLAIIPRQAVAPLMAELEKAGYTPKQTEG